MKYVLDASVAVASLRPNEPRHGAAVAYLSPLLKGADSALVPAIFPIEVASALTRAGFAPQDMERFVGGFLARAKMVTLGPRSARQILRVVATTRLRAADAIDVWLAAREGIPLVTADVEVSRRASAACQVVVP